METIEQESTERRELSAMSDRELLEEMTQNTRDVADMVGSISAGIQKDGLVGMLRGMMKG